MGSFGLGDDLLVAIAFGRIVATLFVALALALAPAAAFSLAPAAPIPAKFILRQLAVVVLVEFPEDGGGVLKFRLREGAVAIGVERNEDGIRSVASPALAAVRAIVGSPFPLRGSRLSNG